MKVEQQINILKSTYPFLTNKDIEVLLSMAVYKVFPNKTTIIQAGKKASFSFFTLKGMVRGYFINAKGEEKNIFLRSEHTISGAPNSLFDDRPSKYTFEAILETHLLIFNHIKFQELAQSNWNINQIYIAALQENIQTLISRVEALIDRTPEERYEELLQRNPNFFQTAFNKHIANYLGITAVSLSRIIKRKKNAQ